MQRKVNQYVEDSKKIPSRERSHNPICGKGKSSTQKYLGRGYVSPQEGISLNLFNFLWGFLRHVLQKRCKGDKDVVPDPEVSNMRRNHWGSRKPWLAYAGILANL